MKIGTITEEIKKNNPQVYEQFQKDVAFHTGGMVEQARISKGMTQVELAKKIGTKQSAIARIENGSSLPSLTILQKIAEKGFDSYLLPPGFAFMKGKNTDKYFAKNPRNNKGPSPSSGQVSIPILQKNKKAI
ncbi:MAG: Helix-turn-helix domain protein [Candidatus Nomurabacteria bacterium]|nr:Helix-turn-helix domain protein [Candidatus Nomurabacteria bacterium]